MSPPAPTRKNPAGWPSFMPALAALTERNNWVELRANPPPGLLRFFDRNPSEAIELIRCASDDLHQPIEVLRAAITETVFGWSERWLASRSSIKPPVTVIAMVRARLRVCLIRTVGETLYGHRQPGDAGYIAWVTELEDQARAARGFDATLHELTGWRRCRRALIANACLDAVQRGPDFWPEAAAWAARARTPLDRHLFLSVLCPFTWADDEDAPVSPTPLWWSRAESFEDALSTRGTELVSALVPALFGLAALNGSQEGCSLRNAVNRHPAAVRQALLRLAELSPAWVSGEAAVDAQVIAAVPPLELLQMTAEHPTLLKNPAIRAVVERVSLKASATPAPPPSSRAL